MNKYLFWSLLILFLLVGIVIFLLTTGMLTIWEDGSWALGQYPYPAGGCLPFAICND